VAFEYNRKFYVGLYDQWFGQVDPKKNCPLCLVMGLKKRQNRPYEKKHYFSIL
jgi:hypothetical protein